MNRYTQTAADLDGYEHPEPEALGEMIAGIGLALCITAGLLGMALKWWA